jgi:competence protein ComEC
VLLGGDSGAAVHARLLAAAPDRLRAGVLVLPHHGSSTTDLRLIAAVDPEVAIISAGADNPYGHPHREVLTELDRLGIPVRRTDVEGAVTVRLPSPVPAVLGRNR